MTPLPHRALLFALLSGLMPGLALPAAAQGTAEQQEACTPDAVRLCRDTIPDIPKTTACMKAHFAQLTPRCQTAFGEATAPARGAAPAAARTGTARRETAARPAAPPRPLAPAPRDEAQVVPAVPVPERVPGLRSYAAQIAGYCRDGLIDPFTCRTTLDALRLSE